jgi:bifunctional DNA-binding transcriptional regulator/antitoxin component of YhaV-PrlF toxin-antitoxin module
MIELTKLQFRGTVTDLNAVTIPKSFRDLYGIEPKDDVILEFKGRINRTEEFVKPMIKPNTDK